MGIGGGIFLIAIGAIIAFAVHAHISWLDLRVVGWVLMFAGLAVLWLTMYFWHQRRRRRESSMVEEARYVHDRRGGTPPEPPDNGAPPNPMP